MQTSDIIGIQGRLDPGWLATCQKGSNTTYYWSTNLALLTAPTPYHDDLTMKGQTWTTKMSWSGRTNTSAKNTPPFEYSTWTAFTIIWTAKSSKHNIKTKKPSSDGPQLVLRRLRLIAGYSWSHSQQQYPPGQAAGGWSCHFSRLPLSQLGAC